jgi:uncharacterized Zn finger protein (UPF0148 family)
MKRGYTNRSEEHSLNARGIKTKAQEIVYEGNFNGHDYYNWTCPYCKRTKLIKEGEDVAYCPCEFESEGQRKVSRKNQIKMGIEVEAEHIKTLTRVIKDAKSGKLKPFTYYQGRIAKDHLKEIKDYYTRLHKLEKDAGV